VLRKVWGDAELGTRFVRLCSVIGAVVLSLGTFVPVHADSTGTVSVTGAIVASPLSISIIGSPIAFGNIDSAGTPQTSGISAAGFRDTNGAYWVAENPIAISINSPSGWNGTVCEMTGGTSAPGGLAFAQNTKPTTLASAATSYGSNRISSGCPGTLIWGTRATAGLDSRTLYLTTKVFDTDTPRSFNTTIQFSVSTT
jgi:hypothetical protein